MTVTSANSQDSSERATARSSYTSVSIDKERASKALASSSASSGENLPLANSTFESGALRRRRSHSGSPTPFFHQHHASSNFNSRQSLRNGSTSSRVSSLTKDSSIHSLDPLKIEIADLTHMFGRAKEQEMLQASFLRSLKRESDKPKELVFIHGKAGTGKSALILDFKDAVSSTGTGYFCSGKFEKYHSFAKPYSGIIQALNDLCESISVGPDKDEQRISLNENLGYSRLKDICSILPNLSELIMGSSGKRSKDFERGDGDHQEKGAMVRHAGVWADTIDELPKVLGELLKALCRGHHPIIVSLDDLQWVDHASLECISSFIADPALPNLVLVMAYRDDETCDISMLREDHAHRVTDIVLDNLPLSSVEDILSDLTGTPGVADLAAIVLEKTHGNPFSIFQFLEMLQRKELLVFSFHTYKWMWDVDEIKSKTDVTQNVGNLLVEKIEKLSRECRKILTLSAVIGFTFEPKVVELIATHLELLDSDYREHLTSTVQGVIRDAVSGGLIHPDQTQAVMATQMELVEDGSTTSLKRSFYEESIQAALQEAEVEGLVGKAVSRSKYKFAHDLLHKSFYEDTTLDIDRHKLHLQIGRILRSFYRARPEDDLLFAAVDHLNKGSHYLDTDDERIDLIELNQESSEKARARRALFSAANFSSKAIDLLKFEYDWMNHYDLLLHVYNDAAELNFACGRFDLSLRRCLEIHRHARTLSDKLAASYIRVEVLFSQRKSTEAVQSCLSVLKSLDEPILPNPSAFQVLAEWRKTKKMVRRMGSKSFLSLPPMEDLTTKHTQRYLSLLVNMAFLTGGDSLLLVAILRMFQNTIAFGTCDFAPFAIVGFGMLCTVLGTMDDAIKYGDLAIQLCKKMETQVCIPSTYAIFYSTIQTWYSPLVDSINPLTEAYRIGVGIGEVHFAAICTSVSAGIGFHCGVPLQRYTEDLKSSCDQIRLLKQESVWALLAPYWSAAMNLAGAGSREDRKIARDVVDRMFGDSASANTGGIPRLAWRNHHMISYIVSFLFNDYESAKTSRIKMDQMSRAPKGTHFMIHLELFFSGLLDYSLYQETKKRGHFRRAVRKTKQMRTISRKGAVNCKGMSLLLEAESRSRLRSIEPAKKLFEEAMKSFSGSGFIHFEAIANERLAEFLRTRNCPTLQWQSYLRVAIKHYADWGAAAKVNQITRKFDMPARYSMNCTPCPIITIQDERVRHFAPTLINGHVTEKELMSTDFISSEMLTKKI